MGWLSQIIERLFFWVPRLWIVMPDESGIKITLGKWIKDCEPGWYIDWPLIHSFIKVNVALQGVKFGIQSVKTKDDIDVTIRGAILYRISNARKAILETSDFDQTLEAVACGVIESFITNKTYGEVGNHETLKDEIMKGLRKEAEGWGIKLLRVYIPDIGRVTNIRILGDTSIIPIKE